MSGIQRSTMRIDEVAVYLGVSQSTVRRWMKNEGLPALKLSYSGKLLFKKEYIDDWLDKRMNIDQQFKDQHRQEYANLRILKPDAE